MLKHLVELREQKGLTQEEVADYLGVKQQTVSHYETGSTTPGIATLILLAELYGVSTDYLLGRTEIPEPYHDMIESSLDDAEYRMVREYRELDELSKGHISIYIDAINQNMKKSGAVKLAEDKQKSNLPDK